MIKESAYWKSDLVRDAKILEGWSKKNQSSRQYVLFEKKIFISAYSIRKLIESEKIGPDFPMWELNIEKFQKETKKNINHMNHHNLDEFFDLKNAILYKTGIDFLCNQLIHSYIFRLVLNELGEIDSFLFASDRDKTKCIYKIKLEIYLNILRWIGHSDVIQIHRTKDPKERSGFKTVRQYSFDDCIPKKGLPEKSITYLSEYIEDCLDRENSTF